MFVFHCYSLVCCYYYFGPGGLGRCSPWKNMDCVRRRRISRFWTMLGLTCNQGVLLATILWPQKNENKNKHHNRAKTKHKQTLKPITQQPNKHKLTKHESLVMKLKIKTEPKPKTHTSMLKTISRSGGKLLPLHVNISDANEMDAERNYELLRQKPPKI